METRVKPFIVLSSYIIMLCCSLVAIVVFDNMALYFVFNVLAFLILLLIIFQGIRVYMVVSITFFVIVSSVIALASEKMYFLHAGIMLIAITVYAYFHHVCQKEISKSIGDKEKSETEKVTIGSKYKIKEDSFGSLKKRVDEIFKLFEVAREFNECLHFHDVLKILSSNVVLNLPFKQGVLVILETVQKRQAVFKMYDFSEEKWGESAAAERYEIEALIAYLENDKSPIKVDAQSLATYDFVQQDPLLPVWIFPLIVEGKLIAMVIFEGGQEEDFSKFSIIAGQLALQIKKVKLYNTVKELSITDGLTGVFVRRHFLERLDEELKRSIKNEYHLCVLMLDIDHFKMYNDTFGHLVGDVTLREVSKIIKENVRKVDLIARYGGEEFAIVFPETHKQGGLEAAERIRDAIAKKRFKVYDEETRVTVSIGIASFPENAVHGTIKYHTELGLELLQKADQALYLAKEAGRDKVVCHEEA